MAKDKLIYASAARKAILDADPKLAYCIDSIPGVDVPKWIPVSERLPETGKTVLCFTKGFGCWVASWDDCDDQQWSDGEYWCGKCGVTHWMPLPTPPKEDE